MRFSRVLAATAMMVGYAEGAFIDWADWTTSSGTTVSGTVGGIGVDFSGTNISFVQLGTGTNYWTEPAPGPAPYTGNALVDNAPTPSELIALNLPSTNVLTFASPLTNPLMAIVSQGQAGLPVTYDFDTPFIVLSEGRGYWGNGSHTLGAGNQLIGTELHAVIQFQGTVSAITWTSTQENWHGFTIGTAAVPDSGASLLLLGLGLSALASVKTRSKSR